MIDVKKLREKITTHTEELKAAHKQRSEDWDEAMAASKVEWHDAYAVTWYRAIKVIKQKLDAGGVVERSDLPRGNSEYWTEPYTNDGIQRPRTSDYSAPEEVTMLLNGLDLFDTDEVSHTALGRVGINATVMGAVSRWLTRGRR